MRRHVDSDVREAVLVGPSSIGMLFLASNASAPVTLGVPPDRRGDGRRFSVSATSARSNHPVERAVSFSGRRPSVTAMEAEDVMGRRRGSRMAHRRSTVFRDIDVMSCMSDGSEDDLDGYNSDGDKFASGQNSFMRSERENFPWMSVVAEIINGMSTSCNHEYSCENMCVRRQKKRCLVLLEALEELYSHTEKPAKYLKKSESEVDACSVFGDISHFPFNTRGSMGASPNTLPNSLMQNSTTDTIGLAVPGLGLTVNFDKVNDRYTERTGQFKLSTVLHKTIAHFTLGGLGGRGHEETVDGASHPTFRRVRSSSSDPHKKAAAEREKKYNEERIDYVRKQVGGLGRCQYVWIVDCCSVALLVHPHGVSIHQLSVGLCS